MENLNYDLIKEKIEIMISNGQIQEKDLKKVCQCLLLFDNANNDLQKKQAVKLLMSYLDKNYIYKNRAIEIIKYIENNKDLDDKTINLINRYIGILNDPDAKTETKEEVWKNYNVIINNIKKKKITNIDIKSKDFALSLIAIIKDSNDEEEKKTAVAVLGELLNESKKNSVINLIDLLNFSNDEEEKSAAEYCLTGYISEITENFEQIFLIQNAIVFIANDGEEYTDMVLNYIEIIKTASDKKEKEAAINCLKEILEKDSSIKKRR